MLKKELLRYLITGFLAVVTDISVYSLFHGPLGYDLAKIVSFIAGTSVSFTFNKFWTFQQNHSVGKQLKKFSLLYINTLGANVMVNKLSLFILPEYIFLAFLAATATSTLLNFLGNKYWVFIDEVNDTK